MNSMIMDNKIMRMVAAGMLALLLAVAGSCTTSGTYQGGNDSEPHYR